MAECEVKSNTMEVDEDDLEDGEIEDDDDEVTVVAETKPSEPSAKTKDTKNDHHKGSSSSNNDKKASSSSRKRAAEPDEDDDDFAACLANALAENLKRKGIEPPMPNVKKADSDTEQSKKSSSSKTESKSARKRRRRRERLEELKKDDTPRLRPKRAKQVNEDDGFYMVGGSPPQDDLDDDESDDGSTGSSRHSFLDDDKINLLPIEERRVLRREMRERERDRSRERSREREIEKRRRERERRERRERSRERRKKERQERKDRDSEKEVCLRFAENGYCPDDDCQRSHDVRQPKKMELCKFWLMDCCAKRDKCSYMHGDFPCKYYYLGLKCITKNCVFKHGKPLEENIKQILLKHLDTAPKEILGDFPRIGRENATKMMAQTHIKLCKEFNIELPEEKLKIPSLLDMSIQPPESSKSGAKKQNRWGNDARSSPSNDRTSTIISDTISPGDVVLANLKDILSEKQVDSMAAIGVITVSQINNLTVAQLNELGLSFATIGEIQAAAIRIGNEHSGDVQHEKEKSPEKAIADLKEKEKDVDMRSLNVDNASDTIKSPSSSIMSPNQSDVDEIYKKPEVPLTKSAPMNVLMSPPSGTLDLSQYLRDSNLANDDEEENEPSLKIDENYYTSDQEQDDKKDSQSEDDQQGQDELAKPFDLLPPSFDSSNFFKSSTTTKIDVSSSVSQLMEMAAPKSLVETPPTTPMRDPRMRNNDPRKSPASTVVKEAPTTPEIASPTYRDPRQQKPEPERRTSIYEIESPSEEEEVINIDKDKDMRFLNTDNGDVDLRFPFPPMANYVPATEIEASYGIHTFDTFEVKVIEVPKPDYSDIRRSFRNLENTQDPRLKKLFGIGEVKQQDSPRLTSSNNSAAPSDPRKRRVQEQEGPKKLQISTILQNSKHYNELSSSQKMVVNEVLAELTKELKAFHGNPSPSKIFDNSFITQRPKLQQVLIGLGVFVNNEGDFEEIKDVPMMNMPTMPIPPPIAIPNLTSLPISLNQPPPMLVRPGLLGFAPPPALPFASNIMESNEMNFTGLNQMAFDQFANRGGNNNSNNGNNNRRDQRQNFRNNNNNRNNNNYRNRRN